MRLDFQRVAILSRGEPAMRLIRAIRELSAEPGREPIHAIALFAERDRGAPFVREADDSMGLGEPLELDGAWGPEGLARLERALREARAEALWPGWGPDAARPQLADLCARVGVVFLGPGGDALRRLADPAELRRLAEAAGLGGATGEGAERAGARRLALPFIADAHGAVWTFGACDRTIVATGAATGAAAAPSASDGRRGAPLLVEAPAPILSAAEDEQLRGATARLCRAVGYVGAGAIEVSFDARARTAALRQVHGHLPAHHAVTEETAGVDLVKLQLHVARGGPLEGPAPTPRGHAAAVRLRAEPVDGAAPGTVARLRLPAGPGVRVDAALEEGDAPPPGDGALARIVAHGRDRAEALARLRRALAETVAVVEDGATSQAALLALLARPELHSGEVDAGWLDRPAPPRPRDSAAVALLAAAVSTYEAEFDAEEARFFDAAARGRPQVRAEAGYGAELRWDGRSYRVSVSRVGPGRYEVEVGGARVAVALERHGRYERWLSCGGRRHRVVIVPGEAGARVEVDGAPHAISRDDAGVVRAPAPAVVLAIFTRPGEAVEAGARLMVLEAMKMELPITAPAAGTVRRLAVMTNVQVSAGAPLLYLEPAAAPRESEGAPLSFADLGAQAPADPRARLRAALSALRAHLLGYDVPPAQARRAAAELEALGRELPPDDEELFRGEQELVAAFVDLCGLFRRQPSPDDPEADEAQQPEEHLFRYLREPEARGAGLPAPFLAALQQALRHHGLASGTSAPDPLARTPALDEALLRICKARGWADTQGAALLSVLERWLRAADALRDGAGAPVRDLLGRLIAVTHGRFQALCDLCREVRYRYFDRALFEAAREQLYSEMDAHLAALAAQPAAPDRQERLRALVDCPQPLVSVLGRRIAGAGEALRDLMLEVLTRRYYRIRDLRRLRCGAVGRRGFAAAEYDLDGRRVQVIATHGTYEELGEALGCAARLAEVVPQETDIVLDLYLARSDALPPDDQAAAEIGAALRAAALPRPLRRVVTVIAGPGRGRGISSVQHFTFRPSPDDAAGYAEQRLSRGLHPMMGKRLQLWRLGNFETERLPSAEDVYLFLATARGNPKDRRLFAYAEVRDLTPVRDAAGRVAHLPDLERMLMEALAAIRQHQVKLPPRERFAWNRVQLYVWPVLDLRPDELSGLIRRLAPLTEGLGVEQVLVRARIPDEAGVPRDTALRIANPAGTGLLVTAAPPPDHPIRPLGEYEQKVARMRQRGLTYPYEIIRMLTAAGGDPAGEVPPGEFTEYDLDELGAFRPVSRPPGQNSANIVAGVIRSYTRKHPDGMARVILLGDPSHAMGALAEPECRRIIAALELATERSAPIEWFALSAGAKISMDSGTENMDWIALVLRRIVEFTQAGGEINVVVNGINVGAQPYWNAEATMLQHTRGVLIMTPQGAMVLTGKQALDYSGSVSAEDNLGIGGYERVMGPNGQAQYLARDLADAIRILFRHYEHCYVAPGERFPRRAVTADPAERDPGQRPHDGEAGGFALVGDIFSAEKNPGRKRPFDIRRVMGAVIDQDLGPLERWGGMRDAEIAVVWDAHLGGYPVCLIGIESHPLPRKGAAPADGPDHWTAGTLFPRSSKKVARALNAASGNRPAVILANLSGFDGSPESLRELQLEYGAEIGRAVVNFRGPVVFCVVSRYHGGAYVVFSGKLNDNLEIAAVEGSYASVIGGAPAAAVVFAGEVDERTRRDPRLQALEAALGAAVGAEKGKLRAQLELRTKEVRSEKLGQVAEEFDRVHSVQRALKVGSIDYIIPAPRLRAYLIEAVERGMRFAAFGERLP